MPEKKGPRGEGLIEKTKFFRPHAVGQAVICRNLVVATPVPSDCTPGLVLQGSSTEKDWFSNPALRERNTENCDCFK